MALVVFFRGINVGGHRTFRPSLLAKELAAYDVVNVGAAGTLVVRKPCDRGAFLAELRRKLPFEATVACCDGKDLIRLVIDKPFGTGRPPADAVPFVSILAKPGRPKVSLPVTLPEGRKWLVRIIGAKQRFVYGVYRRHMKTIGCLGQIDRLFGATATTRSWSTILAVVRILESTQAATPPVLLAGGNPQIAKAEGDAPVQEYIAAMPGWKRDAGRRLDALIARTVPGVRKAVKWNSPLYGIEGRGWFLGIHTLTNYVKVAFFRGTSLRPVPPGPSKSKDTRYLNIYEDGSFDEAQFADWVRQASRLPGWKL